MRPKDCSEVNKDVVFVVDSSWKPADNRSWFNILSLLHGVVDKLLITRRTTRVAVVRYSDAANLSIALSYVDQARLLISDLRYEGDERNDVSDLAHALDTVSYTHLTLPTKRIV